MVGVKYDVCVMLSFISFTTVLASGFPLLISTTYSVLSIMYLKVCVPNSAVRLYHELTNSMEDNFILITFLKGEGKFTI